MKNVKNGFTAGCLLLLIGVGIWWFYLQPKQPSDDPPSLARLDSMKHEIQYDVTITILSVPIKDTHNLRIILANDTPGGQYHIPDWDEYESALDDTSTNKIVPCIYRDISGKIVNNCTEAVIQDMKRKMQNITQHGKSGR